MYKAFCVIAGLTLLLPLWAVGHRMPDSGAGELAALKGKSRPLLIFYPQNSWKRPLGASVELQRSALETHRAELNERNVDPIYIPLEASLSGVSRNLRNRFHVDDGEFTVVLIGKDGGEKFRSHEPVTIEKLEALIDAMPMRQQEVQDGHHSE